MRKNKKSPLAASMGAAFISTLAATSVNADVKPFGMTELDGGYMQMAEAEKTGEMKCGANMPGMAMPKGEAEKTGEMKCGANMPGMAMPKPKTPEGACAGNKPAAKPAPKSTEGK